MCVCIRAMAVFAVGLLPVCSFYCFRASINACPYPIRVCVCAPHILLHCTFCRYCYYYYYAHCTLHTHNSLGLLRLKIWLMRARASRGAGKGGSLSEHVRAHNNFAPCVFSSFILSVHHSPFLSFCFAYCHRLYTFSSWNCCFYYMQTILHPGSAFIVMDFIIFYFVIVITTPLTYNNIFYAHFFLFFKTKPNKLTGRQVHCLC